MSEPVFAQVIETSRMWLRCPLPGDGDALYQCVQQTLAQLQTWPDSLPWAQQAQSPDISEDYCQTCYAAWVMGLRWPLLMWDKHTEQLAGSIGFHQMDHESQTWELGYWCRLAFQGQGRTTEAVSALTAYALSHRHAQSCQRARGAKGRFSNGERRVDGVRQRFELPSAASCTGPCAAYRAVGLTL